LTCPGCGNEYEGERCGHCGFHVDRVPVGCIVSLFISAMVLAGIGCCFYAVGVDAGQTNTGFDRLETPFYVAAGIFGVASVTALICAWRAYRN
jgi:hypothetical protein